MSKSPLELQIALLQAQQREHANSAFLGCCLFPVVLFIIMLVLGVIMSLGGGR